MAKKRATKKKATKKRATTKKRSSSGIREKSRENGIKKREKNLIPFKPGQSGNPKGKKPGTKNFSTLAREAMEALAKDFNKKNGTNLTGDDIHLRIIKRGLINAESGNYQFYKDFVDRTHGTTKQKHEIINYTPEHVEAAKHALGQLFSD